MPTSKRIVNFGSWINFVHEAPVFTSKRTVDTLDSERKRSQ
jgi:hypothetical protein